MTSQHTPTGTDRSTWLQLLPYLFVIGITLFILILLQQGRRPLDTDGANVPALPTSRIDLPTPTAPPPAAAPALAPAQPTTASEPLAPSETATPLPAGPGEGGAFLQPVQAAPIAPAPVSAPPAPANVPAPSPTSIFDGAVDLPTAPPAPAVVTAAPAPLAATAIPTADPYADPGQAGHLCRNATTGKVEPCKVRP